MGICRLLPRQTFNLAKAILPFTPVSLTNAMIRGFAENSTLDKATELFQTLGHAVSNFLIDIPYRVYSSFAGPLLVPALGGFNFLQGERAILHLVDRRAL